MMDLDEEAFDYAFESVPKLVGRANFVTWEMNVMLALGVLRLWDLAEDGTESFSDLEPAIRDLHDMWIAAYILETCDQSVKDQHTRIFDEDGAGRTRALLQALEKSYGVMAHRSILGLGMDFMYSKCEEGQDVEDWMDTVSAQRRALEEAKFTIEDMAVIVILRGLPSRFHHYVDHVLMTGDKVPKLDEVRRAIRAINAAHQVEMKRKEEDLALAARARQLAISEQQSGMDTPPKSRSGRRRRNKKRREKEEEQEVQVEYALTAICL